MAKFVYAKAFNAPELDTNRFDFRYIAGSLAGDAATNVMHELIRAARKPDMSFYEIRGRSIEDSYYPLSVDGKLIYWLRSIYAVRNLASEVLLASRPVIYDQPDEPVRGDRSTHYGFHNYHDAYNYYGQLLFACKDGLENDIRYRAKRLGAGFAESETYELFVNFAIPVLFDMDPRYVPLVAGDSTGECFGHAIEGSG